MSLSVTVERRRAVRAKIMRAISQIGQSASSSAGGAVEQEGESSLGDGQPGGVWLGEESPGVGLREKSPLRESPPKEASMGAGKALRKIC